MIAAATLSLAPGRMLFNWFDVALILVVALGFWRGRKNGMSKELLPFSQWVTIVIAGGFGYQPLGDLLIKQGVIRSVFGKTFNEKTAAYVSSYLLIAIVVLIVFAFIKRGCKARLEGSNAFGSGEYYLGMVSGALRFLCIVIFALALLNAPYYSQFDIQQAKAFSNRWFGGGVAGYSGDFFPSVNEVQTSVFKDSLTGPFLKNNLSLLLVNTVGPGGPAAKPAIISIGQ